MHGMCRRAIEDGITAVAFGDLFLQDIREYRERQMDGTGLTPLFPVWQIPTRELARELIGSGVKAKVTCIDLTKLDASNAGREYDGDFLNSLPAGIDPCGENGEFHTFVYDAPVFLSAIPVEVGERLERDGFVFADLLPV
jgi:diphthamide synthase (EF-2-diphthine--ammonia ligase)